MGHIGRRIRKRDVRIKIKYIKREEARLNVDIKCDITLQFGTNVRQINSEENRHIHR